MTSLHRTSMGQRAVSALLAAVCFTVQLACPPRADAGPLGSSTASAGSALPPSMTAIQSFQPDLFTGRATTSMPIEVPPGRHGMQPSLALQYSSTTPNGWLGVGWSLDVGYIELSTKKGQPYYQQALDTFTIVFQGISTDLVQISGGTYRAKDEGLFLRLEYKGAGGWEARDKSGTLYRFGTSYLSQISGPGANNVNVFRWALSDVTDTNGNRMTCSYTIDPAENMLYLSRIEYAAGAGLSPTNRVDFLLEPAARPDVLTSYASSTLIKTTRRLQAIVLEALVGGQWQSVRRYDLGYTLSRRSQRSLLTSVTQRGTDGSAWPATTFAYQDGQAVVYTKAASSIPPKPLLAGDADGDGLADWITYDSGTWSVALSSGGSFAPASVWLSPFGNAAYTPVVGDWNGDGRADIAAVIDGSWAFAYSTGTAFAPAPILSPSIGRGAPLTGEFTGDGLMDVGTFSAGAWQFSWGRIGSFVDSGWTRFLGTATSAPVVGDFNGDGMTDIGVVDNGTVTVALASQTDFLIPGTVWRTGFGSSANSYFTADFNGDGATDVAFYDKTAKQVTYAPSNGAGGFGAAITLPVTFTVDGDIQVADFNGDGLADLAVVNPATGASEVAMSSGGFADVLAAIDTGVGGRTSIEYQSSAQVNLTRPTGTLPQLPFAMPIVSRVTMQDGLGNSYPTTYTYAQGRYDATAREFRGFGHVEARDPAGTVTSTDFSQDAVLRGRPLQTEVRDAAGVLWTKTVQSWSSLEINHGEQFVRLDQTQQSVCDGAAACKTTQTRFAYDSNYGNVTQVDEDGDIDAPGLKRRTTTTYAYNDGVGVYIVNKPQLVQTLDVTGATPVVLAQRRFYYDNATSITMLPTIGNLTKEEEWLSPDPATPSNPAGVWLGTTLAYDAAGNVTMITDARNNSTQTTYDSSKTFVAQLTNAALQTRQFTYDARFGKIASTIDQNGQTTTTAYDAFGRVSSVEGPIGQYTTVVYELGNPISKTRTCERLQNGSSGTRCVSAFTDGLGRAIQARSPAQEAGKEVVTGEVEFDSRGLVTRQWAPYLAATSASYVPRPGSGLAPPVVYDYDPVGRLIKTTNPDASTTQIVYDRWAVTGIDAEGHRTRRTQDAFGQLVTVEELNDAGIVYATTRYAYDALNRLTQVIDAKGNASRLTYDSLGRKLTMTDPDMGAWSYAYDSLDNLIRQTDARGVVTTFAYDTLNRLTGKSYAVPAGVPNPGSVVYIYDGTDDATKPFAKGRLTKVTDGSGWTSFFYDELGRVVNETKQIDTTYTTQRAYDLLGRVTSLTYPDGEAATYIYNAQGGIDTVKLGTQTIIASATYDAAGQMTRVVYGNGVSTDYSYDPQTLRMTNLVSRTPTATLQDFTYTFDRVGNVKTIGDAVHTGTQSFGYDAQHRLVSAQGRRYGSQTYQYDELGNLIRKEGLQLSYPTAPGSARPHAVSSATGTAGISLTYDANGNVATKIVNGATQFFTFDAENRLTETHQGPTEQVTLTFKPGWNFFSLPLVPGNLAITSVFPTFAADFEQVAKFDPATGTFTHYVGSAGFDDFTALQYGVGYQVYCKNPAGATVTIAGSRATSLAPSLGVGWQLLPAVTLDRATLKEVFGSISYSDLQTYDTSSSPSALKPATDVLAGQAYYVKVSAAGTWTPPLPTSSVSFVYDGGGGRVKQTTSLGTTIYLGELVEKAPSGVTTKYVFAGSERVASKTSTGQLLWYLKDHLGSSNLLVDGSGQVVELTEHLPFGGISRNEGTVDAAHKFTGQRQGELGTLILFPARVYDTQLGRFLQADPFVQAPEDPQSLNRYAYCRNNPIKLVDPSGYGWLRKLLAVVGIIVATLIAPEGIPQWAMLAAQVAGATVGDQVGRALESASSRSTSASIASAEGPGQLIQVSTGQNITPSEAVFIARSQGLDRISIYTNGVETTREAAIADAQELVHALVVFYNPSRDALDYLEAFGQEVLPPGSMAMDRQFAAVLDVLAELAIDAYGHSQGSLTLANSLALAPRIREGSTARYLAPAISSLRARLSAKSAGIPKGGVMYHSNRFDPINILTPYNSAIAPLFGPLRLYGGMLGLARDLVTGFSYSAHALRRHVRR